MPLIKTKNDGMKQRTRYYVAAIICFFLLPLSSFALSAGGIGGRPAHPDAALPYSDSWFIYNLGPGESVEDAITLSNTSQERVTIKLYAVDSSHTADGNFTLEQEDTTRDDVGAWVKLRESAVTLGPGEEREVLFTITIPANVSVGEHSGGIILQKVQPGQVAGGTGASIVTRIGIRVY